MESVEFDMPTTQLTASRIVAQQIESSLHKKVWWLGREDVGPAQSLVFLKDGAATIEAETSGHALDAPALFWLHKPAHCRLVAEAGTTGYLAEFPEDVITRAVGDFEQSAMLRFMIERDLNLPLFAKSAEIRAMEASLSAIVFETQTSQTGMTMLVAAHLRIIFVSMMRVSGADDMHSRSGGSSVHFLQRFRQLVESNFRTHWTISRYANELGISHDRLHAICQRELHRTPKALVAERLAREAGLGLERSTLTIEQLAFSLGFRDPAHFSHFFKRMTGTTPGKFRRLMVSSIPGSSSLSPTNFADWP